MSPYSRLALTAAACCLASTPLYAFSTGQVPASYTNEAGFLVEASRREGWVEAASADGRWRLYASVEPAEVRELVEVLERFYERMDQVLGGPHLGTDAFSAEPVTLVYADNRAAVAAVCDALAEHRPHLASWAESIKPFPRIQHWNPLVAVVRHDVTTSAVQRPDVQLAHMAVQLELSRRYGRLPFWVGEALGYALQDEAVGGIYGFSYHPGGSLEDGYHTGWRLGAQQALSGAEFTTASLVEGSGRSFEQRRAYLQFALGYWWLNGAAEQLPAFLEGLAGARGSAWQIDSAWEPAAAEQRIWQVARFGGDFLDQVRAAWAGVSAEGGPGVRAAAVVSAVNETLEGHGLESYASKNDRVIILSDFKPKEARDALKKCEAILKHIDRALGKPAPDESATLMALMIRDGDAYHDLCDSIGAADPGYAEFMKQSLEKTGFTLYRPPLAAYYHDLGIGDREISADHDVAHNLVHLELNRRYGPMPLWLAEGIACAGEDSAFGEVWANWYREEFVFSASHGDWRNDASRRVQAGEITLRDLYGYGARPYSDDLAHMAFAFATYGLEADRKGLAKLLDALEHEYRTNWTRGGRFEPDVDTTERLVNEAFGERFETKFRRWWQRPPKSK